MNKRKQRIWRKQRQVRRGGSCTGLLNNHGKRGMSGFKALDALKRLRTIQAHILHRHLQYVRWSRDRQVSYVCLHYLCFELVYFASLLTSKAFVYSTLVLEFMEFRCQVKPKWESPALQRFISGFASEMSLDWINDSPILDHSIQLVTCAKSLSSSIAVCISIKLGT
jgi:hypothetical protein